MAQKVSRRRQPKPAAQRPLLLGPGHRVRQKLDAGHTYLLSGAAELLLLEGRVQAVGKTLKPGERVVVPAARTLPLEARSESFLRLTFGANGSLSLLAQGTIPADWDLFAARMITAQHHTILVLGETDTGKTFFVTYLANMLTATGRPVAVIDADPGQSVLGPPTTVAYAALGDGTCFLDSLEPQGLFFTGAYSPGPGFLDYGVALSRVLREAQAAAEVVVVNAPGWVQGAGGRLLSRSAVELFTPDAVALLQRTNELQYIARLYPRLIGYLTVPAAAVARSPAQRKAAREQAARDYFAHARNIELPFREIATGRCYLLTGAKMHTGIFNALLDGAPVAWAERLGSREGILLVVRRPLEPAEVERVRAAQKNAPLRLVLAGAERDLVIGLNDEDNRCLALGLIQRIHFGAERFRIHTPLPASRRKAVRSIQFGVQKLTREGADAGSVEPGYF
jgi:polynucleotide 5'-hydroxyl-kinase GRC3/NOL9